MDRRLVWLFGLVATWMVLRWLFGGPRRRPQRQHRQPSAFTQSRHRFLRSKPPQSGAEPKAPRWTRLKIVQQRPYSFAHPALKKGEWLDLSADGRSDKLQRRGLPVFQNPDELAAWLCVPVNRLAWLSHRCTRGKPLGVRQAHYIYTWKPKRSGGLRLIESPKTDLKAIQRQILTGILNHLPTSPVAHGFVTGRSILTNAQPHVNAAVLVKFDLRDFYVNVGPKRILRLFRRVGYSREVAIWLTRLTTSIIPGNLPFPVGDNYALWRYRHRHLPQGAPTSPALANLVACRLDQRLSGLAKSFGATYTRYADDLTFSGDEAFAKSLRTFIQLVDKLIRVEGFRSNTAKRQVLRRHQRQIVAGVVVNDKLNVCRSDFDRLKAVLHQCVKLGPSTQNKDQHPDFAAHLRGRIAHVTQLNRTRGRKLQAMYMRIDWRR